MKFSVVIPCYKSKDHIAKCLGTIKDQDFKDYEIICVFDGEDKTSQKIAMTFGARVEVIEHSGVQKARNRGLELASGDFVMFSDPDMFWDAGSFRSYAETLDKTGADFAYSGYRWTDGRPGHIPMEFDAHLFNIMNYVDGANPVRTSLVRKIGGWDINLKRFQDWDLWIRVVRAGGVGVKIVEDTTRETMPPTSESISGKYDYEESYKIIQEKHGLKRSDVIITSLAARQHALRIAKLCGWDYWPDPSMIPHEYKAVYLLGMFPEAIEDHLHLLKSKGAAKMLVHWIGTDVLHMQTMIPYINSKALRISFKKHGVKSFVQSSGNATELEELGFNVEKLPLPVFSKMPNIPFPKDFTVAVYDHNGVDDKWHKWLVMELVKSMPDVTFLFFGNKNSIGEVKNMRWVGNKPIKEIIGMSSCLLRLTVHDGFPVAPVEFMHSGRKVITNVEEMKFTELVKIGVINDETIPDIKKSVYEAIRRCQLNPKFDNEKEMKEYYESMLSPEKFKKRIEEVVNG
jgi:glycosyltransferase involved in cell wall biosynthesis